MGFAPAHPGVKISSLITSHVVDACVRVPIPPAEAVALWHLKMQAKCDVDRTSVEFCEPMPITPVGMAEAAPMKDEIINSGGRRGSREEEEVLATSPAVKKQKTPASSSIGKD